MKRVSAIFLLCLLFCGTLSVQNVPLKQPYTRSIKKNAVYFEVLGNAAVWSANYDRSFPFTDELSLVLRLGGNQYHNKDTEQLSFNYLGAAGILAGKGKNLFESSLGYTYFTNDPDRLIVFTTGYRLQGQRGIVFRATPMYIYNTEKGDTFGNSLWFGLSFGYSF